MSTAATPELGTETATIAVQYGDRKYSPIGDMPPPPAETPIRKIEERAEDADLPRLLGEAIWGHLPWKTLSPEETDRQVLVKAYVDSLNQLGQLRRDVENMVLFACLANLEFRQAAGQTNVDARDKAVREKLDEMLEQAACDWLPIRNILDEKLVSQHYSTLRNHLELALTQAIADFTKQFFELLAKLVDEQLFGLVEWLPNHCCGYHFFKQVIIQEDKGVREQTVVEQRFERTTRRAPGQIVGKRTITDTVRGKHYYRLARHVHAVMNAVRTTIGNSRVVMPPQVVRMVEQVPDWLRPFVSVIDGNIFRERIIEQDLETKDWAEAQVRDEPIYGCEPGVIIGRYVLTGWGPREVADEQARRDAIQNTAAGKSAETVARRRAPWLAVAGGVLTLVALLLLVQWLRGAGGGIFALLATIAAIASVWQASFDFAVARRNPTAALAAHSLAATIGFQILLAEWFIARCFYPLSWITPVALLVAAILSHAIGHRFR